MRVLIVILGFLGLGVLSGHLVFQTLAGISMPAVGHLTFPLWLWTDVEAAAEIVREPGKALAIAFLLLLFVGGPCLLMAGASPGLSRAAFKTAPGRIKLFVGWLLMLPLMALLVRAFSHGLNNTITPGFSFNLLPVLVLAGLLGGSAWLVFGQSGWLGDTARWGFAEAPLEARMASLLAGIGAGVLLALVAWASQQVQNDNFLSITEALGGAPEVTGTGMALLHCHLVIVYGLAGAVVGSAVPALAWGEWGRTWRTVAVVFAGVSLAASVGYGLSRHSLLHDDLGYAAGSLVAAAELPTGESPRVRGVVLATAEGAGPAFEWETRRRVYGLLHSEEMSFVDGVEEKLRAYLDAHESPTFFTNTAVHALLEADYAHLRFADIDAALLQSFETPGMVLSGALLAARLGRGAVSPERLEMARFLADPTKVHRGPRISENVARALAFQGDMAAAHQLWDDVVTANGRAPDSEEPAANPLTEGRLAGSVSFRGEPLVGATVGLKAVGLKWTESDPISRDAPYATSVQAAAVTDAEGRFALEDLGHQRGYLVLFLPEELSATVQLPEETWSPPGSDGPGKTVELFRWTGAPGVIELTPEMPAWEGEIAVH
jgi:hypothetical protein